MCGLVRELREKVIKGWGGAKSLIELRVWYCTVLELCGHMVGSGIQVPLFPHFLSLLKKKKRKPKPLHN